MLVFKYLLPYLPSSLVMTQFKMLIVTLMRLKLNLSVMFLADEFSVSHAISVSRVFTNVMASARSFTKDNANAISEKTLERNLRQKPIADINTIILLYSLLEYQLKELCLLFLKAWVVEPATKRVIGNVSQKYSFLNRTVPIRYLMYKDENYFTVLDETAHVCCALVKLNASVACTIALAEPQQPHVRIPSDDAPRNGLSVLMNNPQSEMHIPSCSWFTC
ncbi:hypothetical protein MAR_004100 [Mya arenaria]|uniref:Uncharacterized protein n=1 Tax=Mya arenaria TaxID=6604 RepID=A0ABY7EVY1_MYAAR|nr:hypothetical protein MAR_004100 [Mya arenaria]